ncbi:MAG TPA: 3-deoxy-D-manno-octulosonic acid transferase [Nitrospirae bacterium]|nr:3-deoxy-D-manno-octulosonic acid transferase [bacterium BMS3Abin09]GBE41045.1 3-deoxy-D-manno-octulosonic acid transferase [bacterium BMS3Bbin09]HDH34259.1 3-deoxy-D-manno-octulosonic acid transferase [Nitrospirota bacterium]HDZ83766.1 3-deoxy-D-manno-octulosonic acid transferase [Nitrospirota bacterium]
MLLLYNILSSIALLLYLPWILFKKGPEDRRTFIRERLGLSEYSKTDIWVHAVSVGEIIASLPFLKMLKKEFPQKNITVSTTTYTGQKIARESFPEADRIMYIPVDTALCVKRVVNVLKPEIFVVIETELWPMLFQSLKENGSRLVTLNGRISNNSFKGYKRIKPLLKWLLPNIDFFYMQDEEYADRIIKLGAAQDRVGVMGSFKFDINMKESGDLPWLKNIKGDILLAASTHKGEEGIMLDAYNIIKQELPGLKLIIAPRHPERFNEVEDIIKDRDLEYVRRSNIEQYAAEEHDIILMDTIGELSMAFSSISITFIGGSLVPVGGHNILEPAYWSKPIIFGPHMDNFPIHAEFLKKDAARQIKGPEDMAKSVIELLGDRTKSDSMGQNAKEIVEKNRGAVKRAVELIRSFIGTA